MFILLSILLCLSGYFCVAYCCCIKPIMFKKKKQDNPENNELQMQNIYIENEDVLLYDQITQMLYDELLYKKKKLANNVELYNKAKSPYKVHSYIGYNGENNGIEMFDKEIVKSI